MDEEEPLLPEEEDLASADCEEKPSLNMLFIRRFLRLLGIVFKDGMIWMYFTVLLTSSAVVELLIYFVGTTTSHYYNVLNDHSDIEKFKVLLLTSVLLFMGSALVKSFSHFIGGYFALQTRRILTLHLHSCYFYSNSFYSSSSKLQTKTSIDSPDQRIADDTTKFAESTRFVLEKSILVPVMVAYYSYRTFNVGSWQSLIIIYSYFLVSSGIAAALSSRLVNALYARERSEGHFRYLHLRIRKFAESIAFLRGENVECDRMNTVFDSVLAVHKAYINLEFPVRIATTFTSEFGAILSFIIISIPIFSGKLNHLPSHELSELISANAFFSMYLINKLTNLTELATVVSDIAGYTTRISQLIEFKGHLKQEVEYLKRDSSDLMISVSAFTLSFQSKHLYIPEFKLFRGQFVVIQGPTGSGKTSFLRLLAGLWHYERFHIVCSKEYENKRVIFIPQTPYLLSNASLQRQLGYPETESSKFSFEDMKQILQYLSFDIIALNEIPADPQLENDPKDSDWIYRLSPGEQQKLSFARLMLMKDPKPSVLFIDEATCFMDTKSEERCIGWCLEQKISLVWITHGNRTSHKPNKIIHFV